MSNEPGSSKSEKLFSTSFNELNTALQSAALNSTKLAAGLPADISFHRSVDSDYARTIDACSEKALSLTNRLLKLVTDADPARSSRAKGKRKLEDQEDVVDSFHSVVIDALDQIFERADSCLDEYSGRSKATSVPANQSRQQTRATGSGNQIQQGSSAKLGRLDPALLHASHLPKPQLKFKRRVDNTNNLKWIPGLKHKYNAQVPLGYNLHDESVDERNEELQRTPHPYRYEIEHISYPQRMFAHAEAISPHSFEDTPFTWIETQAELLKMLEKLRVAQEIAVDLEHHSYRTFSGFLCLMQISTREEDFVVDTLALREELQELNEVLTDPKIVKVFHGAESDIVWLQQNLDLYIVNLFDTFHASKVLDFPKHGLAALLTMYCDYVPDKRYQLADWRIRPLPIEMLEYARSDTHFLLFIYDNLRNALLDRAGGQPDLVQSVLKRSEETALRTYEKDVYDFETGSGPSGWDTLMSKWNKVLSGLQLEVYRAVHSWRDKVAREEDESTRYVLPNHYLFQLAESPPADMAALLSVFRPVPPLIRTKAMGLLETIRVAVKESLSPKLGNGEGNKMKPREEIVKVPTMDVNASSASADAQPSTSNDVSKSVLWSSQRLNISASSSSLLGASSSKAEKLPLTYISSESSLFSSNVLRPTTKGVSRSSTRYQEVVSRVHSTLVLVPSVPKVNLNGVEIRIGVSSNEGETKTAASEVNSAAVAGDVEIPFVPPSERQTVVTETVEDTIVVVGRAKQKKRKRTKTQEQSDEEPKEEKKALVVDGSAKSKKSRREAIARDNPESPEPFDYSSAPNFFDEPVHEATKPQAKSKGKKGKTVEYGDFPAPPRAYSEVKGGSKSHTFR